MSTTTTKLRQQALAATSLLAACLGMAACLPTTKGTLGATRSLLVPRLGEDVVAHLAARRPQAVADLLQAPLTQQRVVAIAMANSPALAAALADIDIAVGDLGIVLAPPGLDLDGSIKLVNNEFEYEAHVLVDVIGLVNRAVHTKLASATKLRAAAVAALRAIEIATDAELAFLAVQFAQQEVNLRQQVFDAADAAVELRKRMFDAGNTTDLAMARELDQREQTRIELGRAQLANEQARERLNATLGLAGAQTNWRLTTQLDALPPTRPGLDDLETTAVVASLDLQALAAQTDALGEQAGIARKRQWLPNLGAGVAVETHDGAVVAGPAIRLGFPGLNAARGFATRTLGMLHKSEALAEATAVEVRAAARSARVNALATYAEAVHWRDIVVPLRQRIVQESLLHYNAMNVDPFALLMAQRELTEGKRQALLAHLRFAQAMVRVQALQQGLLRRELLSLQTGMPASDPPQAAPAGGHQGH